MFCITIKHKSSCITLFLIYCKNFTSFLIWVLSTCLATSVKNDNALMFICMRKWTPFLTSFLRLQTCYFEYFENARSCPPIVVVSPCRKFWCSKCWNQLVGNWCLHAKSQLHHKLFFCFWDIVKALQTCYFGNLVNTWPSPSKL